MLGSGDGRPGDPSTNCMSKKKIFLSRLAELFGPLTTVRSLCRPWGVTDLLKAGKYRSSRCTSPYCLVAGLSW